MTYKGSELYFETVWASLSEGLRKRMIAAVKKSMEATEQSGQEVIIDSLSKEHEGELEWMIIDDDSYREERAFFRARSGSGSKTRVAIRIGDGMVECIKHHVTGASKPSAGQG